MTVDFALERRRAGLSAEHTISEPALLRFRPIMMTTFATIFGTLPIVRLAPAPVLGAAAARHRRCRRSLRIAAFDAVHHAPVIYLYLDRIDRRLKRRLEPQAEIENVERPHVAAAE
jgi:HAE1 family hydrophobic/amphiphilic exporter-1